MEHHGFTEYRPNQRFGRSTLQILKESFANVMASKDLIIQLYRRDFFAQYKKSFIGIGWALITPVFAVASWLLMQLAGVLKPGDTGVPYPVYLLLGSTCWGFFINMVQAGATTLTSGADLIQQIKYPHEALLFKQALMQITNFFISLLLILVIVVSLGVIPSWKIIFLPLALLPLFFLGAGIGLLVAIVGVVAVDISRFVNQIMVFLIYTAPIIYSESISNIWLRWINAYNPLTYLVCSCRDVMLYGRLYQTEGFLLSSAGALVFFLVVWRAFYVNEMKLVERMV